MTNNQTLVKTIFGSQLYGTSTANSDEDFKLIYKPSISDIILQKVNLNSSTHETNKEIDSDKSGKGIIETEFLPIHKFLSLAKECQTMAIDILFAPPSCWIEHNRMWEVLYKKRKQFISKNIMVFVRYARNQANKYGFKGSRLNTIKKFKEFFAKFDKEITISVFEDDWIKLVDENCEVVKTKFLHESSLKICGKTFPYNTKIKYVYPVLAKFYEEYGERAILASENKCIDYKAISHFARACFEAQELVKTNDLVFPLAQADYLRDIKTGKLNYNDICPFLENLLSETEELITNSTLKEKSSFSIDDYLLHLYEFISAS